MTTPEHSVSSRLYLVVIDGAGEYRHDFNVVEIEATSPREAVDKVTEPEMGYGRSEDGVAIVIKSDDAAVFSINDTTRKRVEPESIMDWRARRV